MFLTAKNRLVSDEQPRLSELAEPARHTEFEEWLHRQQQEEQDVGQRLLRLRRAPSETYGFD